MLSHPYVTLFSFFLLLYVLRDIVHVKELCNYSCHRFSLKQRSGNADGEVQAVEVTVYDYFVSHRKIDLRYSGDFPCINVGKPKRPTYIPLEVNKC